ncbi:hypothetical protein D3C83_244620 [compost metagenome]
MLIDGDFYDGDLLSALLRPSNWKALTPYKSELAALCAKASEAMALNDVAPEERAPFLSTINDYLNTQV